MATFAYKVIDESMSVTSGTIVAETPRQARDMLRNKGVTIQEIIGKKANRQRSGLNRLWTKRYTARVVEFVRELSTLLAVGIPLLEAIDAIAKQHRGGFHTVLLMLRDRVSSGVGLAEAMRDHPAVFDELCVSITEVGENSGALETALERLAQFKERSLQLKNRVATALMYPCVVLVTGLLVSVFLMTFVVPGLLSTLQDAGQELPFATRVVKSISDTLLGWWWLMFVVLAGLAIGARFIGKTDARRTAWHRFQLRVPIVGDMIRKQCISRMAMVVATLMRSGVVFLRSIEIAGSVTPNLVLREALQRCEKAVTAGQDIDQALEQTGVFTPATVRVFAAGQQSGRLEEMLERLAEDYDRQLATASQRLTTILEPVLILALAVVVGFIAFATMMPILEAGNVL